MDRLMASKSLSIIGPITRAQNRAEKAYVVYQSLLTAWRYTAPGKLQERRWREAQAAHRVWMRHQNALERLRKKDNP